MLAIHAASKAKGSVGAVPCVRFAADSSPHTPGPGLFRRNIPSALATTPVAPSSNVATPRVSGAVSAKAGFVLASSLAPGPPSLGSRSTVCASTLPQITPASNPVLAINHPEATSIESAQIDMSAKAFAELEEHNKVLREENAGFREAIAKLTGRMSTIERQIGEIRRAGYSTVPIVHTVSDDP